MKQVVTQGIILTRVDFGEADRILTVLTPDYGKVRVIAKGVRKIKSKLAGGIELFSVSHITLIEGRGEIKTLVSSRLKQHYATITGDIDRTMFGYEVLKKINKITEDNSGEEYFDLLQAVLEALNVPAISLECINLWLSVQLLSLAGHIPNLKTDSQGNKLSADHKFSFDFEAMAFVPAPQGRYSSGHIKLLRLARQADTPDVFTQVRGADQQIAECAGLARQLLTQHLSV